MSADGVPMHRRVWVVVSLTGTLGCIEAPPPAAGTDSHAALPFEATEPYSPFATDPTQAGFETSGGDASTSSGTGRGSSSGGETDTEPSGGADEGEAPGGFAPPQRFGDDAAELALIGSWATARSLEGAAFEFTVDSDGTFDWLEVSDGCSQQREAHGRLWVHEGRLVLHVQRWDKRIPWNPRGGLEVPFRLRLAYTQRDTTLGLAGPTELTDLWDWQGRSYDREPVSTGPAGLWTEHSELWGLVDGRPRRIVSDTRTADLRESDDAVLGLRRAWSWPSESAEEDSVPETWTDLSPGYPTGAAILGGRPHRYVQAELFASDPEHALIRDRAVDC